MAGTECEHPAAVEESLAELLCPERIAPAGSPATADTDVERGGLVAAAAAGRARPTPSRGGRALGLAAALCLACVVALLAKREARPRGAASADAGEATRLFGAIAALAGASKILLTGASAANAVGGGYDSLNGILHNENMSKEISALEARLTLGYNKTTADLFWRRFLPNVTENLSQEEMRELLFPPVHRHDGNVCYDDEEEFTGLCYKQCSLLTFGTHPYRTSAFSCCRKDPCDWDNTAYNMNVCGGFDVSGDTGFGICPHIPGACLANEELLNGLCYKRCAILTEGEYLFRTGPSTCCKFRSQLACTAGASGPGGAYDIMDTRFATGGGLCTKELPCTVHLPIRGMAENEVWQPWENLTDELEGSTTTEEAVERLLDDTTPIGEPEVEMPLIGIAPVSAADSTAAAIAAEEKAIAVVEEAVEVAKEAAAVAKEAQAALSAEESANGSGSTTLEGSITTKTPWTPSVEAAALK